MEHRPEVRARRETERRRREQTEAADADRRAQEAEVNRRHGPPRVARSITAEYGHTGHTVWAYLNGLERASGHYFTGEVVAEPVAGPIRSSVCARRGAESRLSQLTEAQAARSVAWRRSC